MVSGDGKDVGFLDDLIFGLEHAIGAEEHAKQSYVMTKDDKWLDIAKKVRRERSKLMYGLIPKTKDETYCFVKHLLGWAMSLKEIGDRYIEDNNLDLAKECFELATLLESLVKLFVKGGKK